MESKKEIAVAFLQLASSVNAREAFGDMCIRNFAIIIHISKATEILSWLVWKKARCNFRKKYWRCCERLKTEIMSLSMERFA